MRVGIVSDTHDNVDAAERAVERFEAAGVEVVVHCGDFIAPPTLPAFGGVELHGVFGNNDGEVAGLQAAFDGFDDDSMLHGRFAGLEFDGRTMAVLHGESKAEVNAVAASGEYDYVCYGHHHVREHRTVGETTVINPGAHFPTVPEEHRTVAVLETGSGSVEFRSVLE